MKLSRLQKIILNAVSFLYHGGLTGMCLESYRVREFDNTQVGNLEEYLAQQLECLVSTDILECEVFKRYHESVNDINSLDEALDDKFFRDSVSVGGITFVRIPNSFKAAFNRAVRQLIRRGFLYGYVKVFVVQDSDIQLIPLEKDVGHKRNRIIAVQLTETGYKVADEKPFSFNNNDAAAMV
jgi:hypothetical protein